MATQTASSDVASSRTGSTKHIHNAARVKRQAQADGLTHCPMPECGALLNYDVPHLDESAEADHILEARHGGTDDYENYRVICRKCNVGRNQTKARPAVPKPEDFPVSRQW